MGTSPPRPSFTKDAKKRDFFVHPIRKSAAKARLIPAPTAAPFTPQTTGCGILACQTNKRNKPRNLQSNWNALSWKLYTASLRVFSDTLSVRTHEIATQGTTKWTKWMEKAQNNTKIKVFFFRNSLSVSRSFLINPLKAFCKNGVLALDIVESFKSYPAQNAAPSPRRIKTRTSLICSVRVTGYCKTSKIWCNSRTNLALMAFIAFGRFRITSKIPSSGWQTSLAWGQGECHGIARVQQLTSAVEILRNITIHNPKPETYSVSLSSKCALCLLQSEGRSKCIDQTWYLQQSLDQQCLQHHQAAQMAWWGFWEPPHGVAVFHLKGWRTKSNMKKFNSNIFEDTILCI